MMKLSFLGLTDEAYGWARGRRTSPVVAQLQDFFDTLLEPSSETLLGKKYVKSTIPENDHFQTQKPFSFDTGCLMNRARTNVPLNLRLLSYVPHSSSLLPPPSSSLLFFERGRHARRRPPNKTRGALMGPKRPVLLGRILGLRWQRSRETLHPSHVDLEDQL